MSDHDTILARIGHGDHDRDVVDRRIERRANGVEPREAVPMQHPFELAMHQPHAIDDSWSVTVGLGCLDRAVELVEDGKVCRERTLPRGNH